MYGSTRFFPQPPVPSFFPPTICFAADPLADKYIACGIEAVMEMEAVRDFALLRGLVYPRAVFTEMRLFAAEVHNVDIDGLVSQAHDSCEMMVRENGSNVGVSVGRGIFEASLMGSFMW